MNIRPHVTDRYLERVLGIKEWNATDWIYARKLVDHDLKLAQKVSKGFEFCGVQFVRRGKDIVTCYYN